MAREGFTSRLNESVNFGLISRDRFQRNSNGENWSGVGDSKRYKIGTLDDFESDSGRILS